MAPVGCIPETNTCFLFSDIMKCMITAFFFGGKVSIESLKEEEATISEKEDSETTNS